MSPLSALAGVGAGAVGLFTPGVGGKTPYDNIKNVLGSTTAGAGMDLGGGLYLKPDGSIAGGTLTTDDSGLSNDDLWAQTVGYNNYQDYIDSMTSPGED
jgi:hypothetical protein